MILLAVTDEDRAARQQRAIEQVLAEEDRREAAKASAPKPARLPAAGWYRHPTMANTQRYWDGTAWTDHIAPGLPAPPTAHAGSAVAAAVRADDERKGGNLLTAGIVMLVIFPIGGFIAGVALLSRRPGAGVGLMLGSVFSAYVWFQILTPNEPTYSGLAVLLAPWGR